MQSLLNYPSEWAKETAASLQAKSPTSLKVTLRALRRAKKVDFDTCINTEFRLTTRFLAGHDFFEGIRAVLIDKDLSPHWQPDNLEKVTAKDVSKYFLPIANELI